MGALVVTVGFRLRPGLSRVLGIDRRSLFTSYLGCLVTVALTLSPQLVPAVVVVFEALG